MPRSAMVDRNFSSFFDAAPPAPRRDPEPRLPQLPFPDPAYPYHHPAHALQPLLPAAAAAAAAASHHPSLSNLVSAPMDHEPPFSAAVQLPQHQQPQHHDVMAAYSWDASAVQQQQQLQLQQQQQQQQQQQRHRTTQQLPPQAQQAQQTPQQGQQQHHHFQPSPHQQQQQQQQQHHQQQQRALFQHHQPLDHHLQYPTSQHPQQHIPHGQRHHQQGLLPLPLAGDTRDPNAPPYNALASSLSHGNNNPLSNVAGLAPGNLPQSNAPTDPFSLTDGATKTGRTVNSRLGPGVSSAPAVPRGALAKSNAMGIADNIPVSGMPGMPGVMSRTVSKSAAARGGRRGRGRGRGGVSMPATGKAAAALAVNNQQHEERMRHAAHDAMAAGLGPVPIQNPSDRGNDPTAFASPRGRRQRRAPAYGRAGLAPVSTGPTLPMHSSAAVGAGSASARPPTHVPTTTPIHLRNPKKGRARVFRACKDCGTENHIRRSHCQKCKLKLPEGKRRRDGSITYASSAKHTHPLAAPRPPDNSQP